MPIISGGGSGGLPGVTVSGAAATSKALIATSSSAASWAYPPGFEIGYAQITATVSITDTSEATATALISSGALTFDGAAVYAEVYSAAVSSPSNAVGSTTWLTLFEGSTELCRLVQISCLVTGTSAVTQVASRFKLTPTAGSHTYKVCGFVGSVTGNPLLVAGAGGTGAIAPAFLRFVKV